LADETLIKLKLPDGANQDDFDQNRISLAECDDPAALYLLIKQYWQWHFDASLSNAVRTLLAADLGWDKNWELTTPPVGEVISPLGIALDSSDEHIRQSALQVLDAIADVPDGCVLIGDELTA